MGKLTKHGIDRWIVENERFDARGDGENLWLRYRTQDLYPRWFFRYAIRGRRRVLHLGSYRDFSLSEARALARKLRAEVALGYDVAQLKKDRVKGAALKAAAARDAFTISALVDDHFQRYIEPRWKNHHIVRSWIDNRINPAIGSLAATDLQPSHIDALLSSTARAAPSTATKLLGYLKKVFAYGVKAGRLSNNPALLFTAEDAGGRSRSRSRWLTANEIRALLCAMEAAEGWAVQNTLAVRLLLILAVRKVELIQAKVSEFDLLGAVWKIPSHRTKSNRAIDIPLPPQAVADLRRLIELARGGEWLFLGVRRRRACFLI
jgi:hypothetical protein